MPAPGMSTVRALVIITVQSQGPPVLVIECLLSTHLCQGCVHHSEVFPHPGFDSGSAITSLCSFVQNSSLCPCFFIVKMEMTVAPLSWAAGGIDCSGAWQELGMVPSMHKGWYEAGVVIISFWPTGSSVLVWISSITLLSFQSLAET